MRNAKLVNRRRIHARVAAPSIHVISDHAVRFDTSMAASGRIVCWWEFANRNHEHTMMTQSVTPATVRPRSMRIYRASFISLETPTAAFLALRKAELAPPNPSLSLSIALRTLVAGSIRATATFHSQQPTRAVKVQSVVLPENFSMCVGVPRSSRRT